MMRRFTSLALLASIAALSACGGRGAAPPMASSQPFDYGAQMLEGATLVGPLQTGGLNVRVLVRPQNAQGLEEYAQEANDPSSPLYRQFLTPQQIGARYGATPQDYNAAAGYFAKFGLNVGGWPQHLGLAVAGPVSRMAQAFGTQFGVYSKNGAQFVAPMSAPHFSASIPVIAAENLVSDTQRRRYLIPSPPKAGEGLAAGYSPQTIAAAFDLNGAYAKGYTGSGISIGVIGTGPIEEPGDSSALASAYNVSHVATITQVPVTASGVAAGLNVAGIPLATPAPNASATPSPKQFPYSGAFASPPPPTAPCQTALPQCNPEDGEAQIDTQQAATLAYGSNVLFYLAYNTNDCTTVAFPNLCPTSGANKGAPQLGLNEADAEIEQAIGDDTADIISISYGIGETQQPGTQPGQYEALQFAALAAEGIAVFVSSGDNGAAGCLTNTGAGYLGQQCVSYPASDPNVTAVGGVTAAINADGQLEAPMIGWGTNTTLNGTVGSSGSGGGTSTIFSAPSWQHLALHNAMREVPDVSLIGDPNTGVAVFTQSQFPGSGNVGPLPGYGLGSYGGTSVAAPEMAAVWALVLSACKVTPSCATGPSSHPYRLGIAAPYLYSILAGANVTSGNPSFTPHLPYANVFYDVLYGNNSMTSPNAGGLPVAGFNATAGYDEVTGVGVPYAAHLIDAIASPSPAAP